MHRILRNRFISNLRKRRDTTDIEALPEAAFAIHPAHEDRLVLKELSRAMMPGATHVGRFFQLVV